MSWNFNNACWWSLSYHIFIKYLQCYFSFILKYAIFFWGLKSFTELSLTADITVLSWAPIFLVLDPYFFKEAIFFCIVEPLGRVLWYYHTYVDSDYFLGFKILNFNIFGVFRKMNIFLDIMKILWIFFGGSSQNWASFRVISMHFRVFFKVKGTELGYFFGLLKFQIFFWGAWYSWYFWGVNCRPWVRVDVCEKIRVPPLGVELPLFGKESSGTPVYKILVRALFYLHK